MTGNLSQKLTSSFEFSLRTTCQGEIEILCTGMHCEDSTAFFFPETAAVARPANHPQLTNLYLHYRPSAKHMKPHTPPQTPYVTGYPSIYIYIQVYISYTPMVVKRQRIEFLQLQNLRSLHLQRGYTSSVT